MHEADAFNIVALPENKDQLWQNFQGSARNKIRRHKDNFNILTNVSVDDFYPILLEDKLRLNSVPTHTIDELKFLKSKFPDDIIMDVAEHKDTGALAGNCYFRNKKTIESSFYMSQEDSATSLNGTNILVYHALVRAIENNCECFDFGGSTFGYLVDNLGVAKFKESFGAKTVMRSKYY